MSGETDEAWREFQRVKKKNRALVLKHELEKKRREEDLAREEEEQQKQLYPFGRFGFGKMGMTAGAGDDFADGDFAVADFH